MAPSEKLQLAGEMRKDGNSWFSRGDYTRAARRYSVSINVLALDQGYTAAEKEAVRAEALLSFLNRAQCNIKNKKWKPARKVCCLVVNPNAKPNQTERLNEHTHDGHFEFLL